MQPTRILVWVLIGARQQCTRATCMCVLTLNLESSLKLSGTIPEGHGMLMSECPGHVQAYVYQLHGRLEGSTIIITVHVTGHHTVYPADSLPKLPV